MLKKQIWLRKLSKKDVRLCVYTIIDYYHLPVGCDIVFVILRWEILQMVV